jgi:hypothetical protein
MGIQGQNPLKGVTHTTPELIGELGDVAFTAVVAAASFGAHPYDVLAAIAAKMRVRLDPAPVQARGEDPDTADLPPGGGDGEHHPTAREHEVAETRDVFAMLTAVAHAQTPPIPAPQRRVRAAGPAPRGVGRGCEAGQSRRASWF